MDTISVYTQNNLSTKQTRAVDSIIHCDKRLPLLKYNVVFEKEIVSHSNIEILFKLETFLGMWKQPDTWLVSALLVDLHIVKTRFLESLFNIQKLSLFLALCSILFLHG